MSKDNENPANFLKLADRYEGKVERAFIQSVRRMQDSISIAELTILIATEDIRKIMQYFSEEKIEDFLIPTADIVHDAVLAGARLGDKQVNQYNEDLAKEENA
jgi:hypothetical protein